RRARRWGRVPTAVRERSPVGPACGGVDRDYPRVALAPGRAGASGSRGAGAGGAARLPLAAAPCRVSRGLLPAWSTNRRTGRHPDRRTAYLLPPRRALPLPALAG